MPQPETSAEASRDGQTLATSTIDALGTLLADLSGVARTVLDVDRPLAAYGLDSLMITRLNQRLAAVIDDVPVALFFAHRTLRSAGEYLAAHHADDCRRWVDDGTATEHTSGATTTARRAASTGRRAATRPGPGTSRQRRAPQAQVAPTDALADATPAPNVAHLGPGADDRIAIVGLSGRYPRSGTLDRFWQNLRAGMDCVVEIPPERWPLADFYVPDPEEALRTGKSYGKWSGHLEGFARFDPLFFNISPREAINIDPQERLFLESAWELLEDAGYTRAALAARHRGRVGVYVGITRTGFNLYSREPAWTAEGLTPHTSFAAVANRVSHILDLHGPSESIDTMCSASLTALHHACEAVRARTCDLAIAGGVNLCVHPSSYVRLSAFRMLSPDGRCKAFGAQANGYVPGEGVGAVLLKRFPDAIADGDHIYAVILSTAVNHGGNTHGFTVPNPVAQEALILDALDRADIDARTISYVEAHGTGTDLGDPIEVTALTNAFRRHTADVGFCALGSVKSNIGHLEAAAGIAGLTKVILQLRQRQLVPSLHADDLNPKIPFAQTPFTVQRQLSNWERPVLQQNGRPIEYPRRAGVSSFGAGGANAHVIVEEYSPAPVPATSAATGVPPFVVPLSARTPERLRAYVSRILDALASGGFSDADLPDIAYTLQVGREPMSARLAVIVDSLDDLRGTLSAYLSGERLAPNVYRGDVGRTGPETASIAEDEACAISRWVDERQYARLVEAWVQGRALDWTMLHGQSRPRRISLPTYPFAEESYWIQGSGVAAARRSSSADADRADTSVSSSADRADHERDPSSALVNGHLSLAPVWDAVAPPSGQPWPSPGERIALVGEEADQLRRLRDLYPGAAVVVLDPRTTADAVVDALRPCGALDHVMYLTPASPRGPAALQSLASREPDERADGVGRDVYPLQAFRLAKALLALGYDARPLSLTVITRQAHAVGRGEHVQPAHAAVHAFAGCLSKENPSWRIRLLDLPAQEPWPVDVATWLPATPDSEPLAYRQGRWHRRSLVRCVLPSPPTPAFRRSGVYVIVGGAGGVGELVTKYVIERYQARTVWVGRRPLDAEIRRRQQRVTAQAELEPWYVSADATDRASLEAAYQEIAKRCGTVHGVLMTTVGPLDQSVARMSERQFCEGLAAKVDALQQVAAVFVRAPLEVTVCFSSMAAFENAAGMSSYVAGCAFQDSFARVLAAQWPCPIKVVNWGFWGDVGIGARISESLKARLNRMGSSAIDAAAAMAALERVLASPLPQIAFLKTSAAAAESRGLLAETLSVAGSAPSVQSQLPRSTSLVPMPNADEATTRVSLDRMLTDLLWRQLHEVGLVSRAPIDVSAWARAAQAPPAYRLWTQHTLELLRDRGYIVGDAGALRAATSAAPDDSCWAAWDDYRARVAHDAQRRGQIELLDVALRALPDILSGRRPATEVLFPDSSIQLVEGVYKHGRIATYFRDVLAEAVSAYVRARLQQDGSARVRILEIGAGTGGASVRMFDCLAPYRDAVGEYCYTDVSKAFLLHADEHYRAAAPYLTTTIFDVEKAPSLQGLPTGAYDLVLASNVLHATRDIRETVRHAKALLKRHGVLIVHEITGSTLFSHLTFGLLPGWWRFEDPDLRVPGSPAVAPDTWRGVLESEGFDGVSYPAHGWHSLGQQIVAAESDGILRHRRTRSSAVTHTLQDAGVIGGATAVATAGQDDPAARAAEDLRQAATRYLQAQVAQVLRMAPAQLDPLEPWSTYGIDSIVIVQVAAALRKSFASLSAASMFEHHTLADVVEYVMASEADALRRALTSSSAGNAPGARTEAESAVGRSVALPPTWRAADASRPAGALAPPLVATSLPRPPGLDIAIVGLSGRYPGAADLSAFWSRLYDATNCIREVPPERWDWRTHYGERRGQWGTIYSKWGGFLDDTACFDPMFFGISPREVEGMDPQERLFLQEAYACVADAGYTPPTLSADHQVGVYVGVTTSTYQRRAAFWSVANRVSAALGFHGPSLAIDTACSSSLTAIHLACESIANGSSECAIAGGVNLILDPVHYMGLAALTMMTGSDACRPFAAQADGFVPGEGVGAVLLKPLGRAVADGDHIYGVIKGSAINHGGKTNGYTVPSPAAQARVVAQALTRAGVHARAISYVEAHGTGTSLGDPIEIAGLTKAFAQFTDDAQYCAIGSVKSNIGHSESAAGIAGLTKVLLQMQHQVLVESLHCRELNAEIDFTRTPFTVQRARTPWPRPVLAIDGERKEYPRLAGLSSFGAGGSNVHLIVEEYVDTQPTPVSVDEPVLIVLSAKRDEQLRRQAAQLLDAIAAGRLDGIRLRDVAYTLQVGREPMDFRFACVVDSIETLSDTLKRFAGGEANVGAAYRGEVRRRDGLAALMSDGGLKQAVETWIAERGSRSLSTLAELWVKGLTFDWSILYRPSECRRVSLPTYPFAKEHYWKRPQGGSDVVAATPARARPDVLHPLIHTNTSDLAEQRFTSMFTGDEAFLRDHVVNGERLLPGVAQLEMARAAISRALPNGVARGAAATPDVDITLEGVVWVRPLVVTDRPVTVHTVLQPQANGEIRYEIRSDAPDAAEGLGGNPEGTVHGEGRAVVARTPGTRAGERIDVPTLRAGCDQQLSMDACYTVLEKIGLAYGPSHRGLQALSLGRFHDGRPYVIADLHLPDAARSSGHGFELHPSMLDSALQAAVGLRLDRAGQWDGDTRQRAAVPFTLNRLQVFSTPTDDAVVFLRASTDDGAAQTGVQRVDVDICDPHGNVSVRMRGFTARVLERSATDGETETLLFARESTPRPLDDGDRLGGRRHVFVHRRFAAHLAALTARWPEAVVHVLQDEGASVVDAVEAAAWAVTAAIQALLRSGTRQPTVVQVVLPLDNPRASGIAAVDAVLKTAHLENPLIAGGVFEIDPHESTTELLERLDRDAAADGPVSYRAGVRHVTTLTELRASEAATGRPLWKDGGVYLLAGGSGGLGMLVAADAAARARDLRLVIAGRSPLRAEQLERLASLRRNGTSIEYRAVDVTDAASVQAVVDDVIASHGTLTGVLHAAGVLDDRLLGNKTADEFRRVLAPKIAGAITLDAATAHVTLDWFILFSSIAGVFGNAGQADYAMANAFLDRFANGRERLVRQGQRHGRTLSIAWPLWADGGMRMDAAAVGRLRARGMHPLSTTSALGALETAYRSESSQVVVLAGDRRKLLERVHSPHEPAPTPAAVVTPSAIDAPAVADDRFHDQTLRFLRGMLATTLKLPIDRVEADRPLEAYGLDSIAALEMVRSLEPTLGPLSKTLLFEYQDLEQLAVYVTQRHRDALTALFATPAAGPSPATAVAPPSVGAVVAPTTVGARFLPLNPQRSRAAAVESDIAIIGISGRYPQARNLDEFWERLRAGTDCITEIPPERWDYRSHFDADRTASGKTYSKWGGFIDGVDEFDPLFFNISPREAVAMDPQERLFLQCVYETLEDAGYTREGLQADTAAGRGGNVGVFVGVMYEEYQLYGAQAQLLGQPYAVSGNAAAVANRVSYFCNFRGPSLAVDTMCSSSLTAFHLACQSIIRGECELAIAGGVNVSLHPNKYLVLARGNFASPNGRCESFGDGDGYVPAEGVGAALLKPLDRAVADGDHIYAVIKGSAVNHGGKTNGYTVPNPVAQADVVARTLGAAGVHARSISYVEAHGTGTALGDPIEIAGLSRAFARDTADTQYCAIGSVKSNIGHAESAAGIAGVTKVLLQMKHRTLVKSLHSRTLNPHIDFAQSPFVVQQSTAPWPRPVLPIDGAPREYPRTAGVSSFGAGGSNAHLVIQEYIAPERRPHAERVVRPVVATLSAKNGDRLRDVVARLLDAIRLRGLADDDLEDLAYTLQIGREGMEARLACVAGSVHALTTKLADWLAGASNVDDLYHGDVKRHKDTLATLSADDARRLVSGWVSAGNLQKVAELWTKGLAVDWHTLYGSTKPRRISLPPYPFERGRYWIPLDRLSGTPVVATSTTASVPQPSDVTSTAHRRPSARAERILTKRWVVCRPAGRRTSGMAAVIVASRRTAALARALANRLTGSEVLWVEDEPSVATAERRRRTQSAWIDVSGLGDVTARAWTWLPALQAWIEDRASTTAVALCVTKGLESHRTAQTNLGGADRVGLFRMLGCEYARLHSRHVDLDPISDDGACVDHIVAELSALGDDVEVCYRDGERYRACLEEQAEAAVVDDRLTVSAPTTLAFSTDEVLLITGGTSGLGYLCAQHFVRHHGATRIVLTGREPLPPRGDWPSHRHQHDSRGEKIRRIEALEAEGAQVRVLSVPLSDRRALGESVRHVSERFGRIAGVIHCAGTVDRESPAFVRKTAARIRQVLDPKVDGVDSLLACVAEAPLRFVALFSSVSAIVPALGVGLSDYATANAYLDYVAQAHASTLPIVSIQWPSWKDSGTGEAQSAAYRRTGLLSHTDAEGLRLLDTMLLRRRSSVVMPALVDPQQWRPDALMMVQRPSAPAPAGDATLALAESGADAMDTDAATRAYVAGLVATELRIDAAVLEVDRPLADYGMDSVFLAQVLRPISRAVGAMIDPSILFEHPTIESFAAWLTRTYPQALPLAWSAAASPKGAAEPPTQTPISQPATTTEVETRQAWSMARSDVATSAPPVVSPTDIAVVGMACRFPGANDVDGYWRLLEEGRSAIGPVPDARWDGRDRQYAALLDDIASFDPVFFQIAEADARAMDPQALLLLEQALSVWCHAGYALEEIRGRSVGVYIGARSQHVPDPERLRAADNPILAVGQNYCAANIARAFDLRGPAVVLDAACSSALVAMHVAVQALHSGDVESALVGGVSLLTGGGATRLFDRRGILSREPRFHLFDRRNQGAVLGEGAGLVWLKTLDQARRDGDRIYAVIKGLAINNAGRTAGPVAPNLQAEQEVMRAALAKSGRRPEDIRYIDVNGSGSTVTDLIELKAIRAVYRPNSTAPCELGSMKPNIGHPLCAEGIASFIKTVLMLHRGRSVPFLSAEEPMEHFDLAASPFWFARTPTPWTDGPSVAAINCFADGGTNAHVIVEQWSGDGQQAAQRSPLPLPDLRKINLQASASASACFWEQFDPAAVGTAPA